MIMKRLIKTEFYKLCKADHFLLIALLFLYPIMWSVLVYRNEVVLSENGHSMLSWILIQLFSMEKTFILTLVFLLLINTIVGEEKRKLYFPMVQNKGILTEKIYFAKAIAAMKYLFLVLWIVIAGIALCYMAFVKNNGIMATGKIWNTGELIPGIEILIIWILDKCILLPSIFILLSQKRTMVKSGIIIIILNFVDRGIAMLSGISFLSIWSNYANAEHFVSLCNTGNIEIHMSVMIQIILYSGIALMLIWRRKVKKDERFKSRII